MSARVHDCPNCGATVEFKAGTSLLAVCGYCTSAVARLGGDIGELEILGKVAPLAELGSPLAVGRQGAVDGRAFTLVGCIQLDHGAGPWNEWYAAFDDGGWGWVAEAQGRVYLTFPREVGDLPSYAEARVGARFLGERGALAVVERRHARFVAAEGELPHAVHPGARVHYCDVEGPGGVFGTLDYGEDPRGRPELYLGRQLTYEALFGRGLARAEVRAAAAAGLNCPSCGAAVPLRAPDETERVTCPSCDALLDCRKGQELFLLQSMRSKAPEPLLPLGSRGALRGRRFTVHGHLVRSVTVEGTRYPWEEYLLRDDADGSYRWLIEADGHWTFGEPVSAGEVEVSGRGVIRGGDTYRLFTSGSAVVDALRGEFYWKVAVGERVATADHVGPRGMLSRESTGEEESWTAGTYLEPAEVAKAFRLKAPLPAPSGVAPHQPNPHRAALRPMLRATAALATVAAVAGAAVAATSDEREVFRQVFTPEVSPGAGAPDGWRAVGAPVQARVELSGEANLRIVLSASGASGWVFLDGTFVRELDQHATSFGVLADGPGGDWEREVLLGPTARGQHALTLRPEWASGQMPGMLEVRIVEDVFVFSQLFWTLVLLCAAPAVTALRAAAFERRRWSQSDEG